MRRLNTPLKIAQRIEEDKRYAIGEQQTVIEAIYSGVLKEIARRDCIDPLSLARAALRAEGYDAERHE